MPLLTIIAEPVWSTVEFFERRGFERFAPRVRLRLRPPRRAGEAASPESRPVQVSRLLDGQGPLGERPARPRHGAGRRRQAALVERRGPATLARASPEGYRELCRADILPGEICWTAPALNRGRLFLRTPTRAACVFVGSAGSVAAHRCRRPDPPPPWWPRGGSIGTGSWAASGSTSSTCRGWPNSSPGTPPRDWVCSCRLCSWRLQHTVM